MVWLYEQMMILRCRFGSGSTDRIRVRVGTIMTVHYCGIGDTGDAAPLVGVPQVPDRMTLFPIPSGPDNMYWQYRVTITPDKRTARFHVESQCQGIP